MLSVFYISVRALGMPPKKKRSCPRSTKKNRPTSIVPIIPSCQPNAPSQFRGHTSTKRVYP